MLLQSSNNCQDCLSDVPISPCLAIGAAWIFRISILACSFGREISGERGKRHENLRFTKIASPSPKARDPVNHSSAREERSSTYFPIETSGPKQSRIQGVWSVCCHDHLYLTKSIEAVHLIQQLRTEHKQQHEARCQRSLSPRPFPAGIVLTTRIVSETSEKEITWEHLCVYLIPPPPQKPGLKFCPHKAHTNW